MEPLDAEIAGLLVKCWKGFCTEDELRLIGNWLNKHPGNKRLYDELNDIWLATASQDRMFNAFDALNKIKSRRLREPVPPVKGEFIQNTRPSFFKYRKVAAIIVFAVALGILSFFYISRSSVTHNVNQFIEIVAPLGSKSQILLPDSTRVWLNSGSRISYNCRYNQMQREVTLEGEAFFKVAKKQGKQFLVKTKYITIRVLGTSFNVKAYPDEGSIETTLVHGSLVVEQTSNGKAIARTILEPNQRATFIKNEGIVYLSETERQSLKIDKKTNINALRGQVVLSKKVDTDIFTGWKENRLIFRNETFESLAARLERWYDVRIILQNDEIKKYHFNGTIVNETIQDVMEIIKYTLPVRYTIRHNVITIQKK